MKTILNIVTTVLIILFLGHQFYMESCENNKTYKESKCSSEEKSEECKLSSENIDITLVMSTDSTTNIDTLLYEFQETLIGQEIKIDSGSIIINKGIVVIDKKNDTTE